MAEREPFYAKADLTVISAQEPHGEVVERIVMALNDRWHKTTKVID